MHYFLYLLSIITTFKSESRSLQINNTRRETRRPEVNSLVLQLPEVAITVEANKKVTITIKVKSWGIQCL